MRRRPLPASATLALCLIIVGGAGIVSAQPQLTPAEAAALQPVPPESVPEVGTFWSLQRYGTWPPMPFVPFEALDVFPLPDGSFLFDDSQIDYPALEEQRRLDSALRAIEAQYGLESGVPPPPGGGGGSGVEPDAHNFKDYPTNSLWMDILPIETNSATILLHGTVPDVAYEIWSKQSLGDALWTAETWVAGAPDTNTTIVFIPVGTRTNSLFLWARSWGDEDGNGLPDWWELQYFPTNGVDPYSSPMGDGWTILDNYQRGRVPTVFYTPPPPKNVVASLQGTGPTVRLTWESGGGPVTNYIVRCGYYGQPNSYPYYGETIVPPETLSFTNSPDFDFLGYGEGQPGYVVRACFANGDHADSFQAAVHTPPLGLKMGLVRGPLGKTFLTVQSPPPNLDRIRFSWYDYDLWEDVWVDLYATNLIEGTADVSDFPDEGEVNVLLLQAITADGPFSAQQYPTYYGSDDTRYEGSAYYSEEFFVDAQLHLKENLKFLLASATISHPFSYAARHSPNAVNYPYPQPSHVWEPEVHLARPETPPHYEYYGFHFFSSNLNYSVLQPVRPLQENYLWRNFLFDPLDFNQIGYWTNGIDVDFAPFRLLSDEDPVHYVLPALTTNSAPLALQLTNAAWLYAGWSPPPREADPYEFADRGLIIETNGVRLLPGLSNIYGLRLLSVIVDESSFYTLLPDAAPAPILGSANYFLATELPNLYTDGYYFASQTPRFRYGVTRPPLPGSPDFTVTNSSPLLIASFAEPYTISGWARQAIINGDPQRYAFLEQYFEAAYQVSANGTVTTNNAGLLSPYGEFFPTHPGPAAIVTVPDIETGQRGTGFVHVIKLQLDVNHDGTMDLSFAGPDNTSQERPFLFWLNNDSDVGNFYGDPGHEQEPTPGWGGGGNYQNWRVPCQRDLEDWTRLWVCGVPPLTNGNYQVTLSWATVLRGDPALNLVSAIETNGGTLYLTSAAIAEAQATYGWNAPGNKYPTVALTNSLTLPPNLFTNGGNKYFLLEGRTGGSGKLLLTITQNSTNVIAQTGAWLDLRDVKELYERAIITNIATGAISNWTSSIQVVEHPTTSAAEEDINIIVYVHGFDNTQPSWLVRADTVFKRLYWAGFHGKFASVRWPCKVFSILQPTGYNQSELQAFKAASALTSYLQGLRSRFPGYGVHIFAHSQGNAIASEALSQGAPFDTYILAQAAMPASCYDINAPTNATLLAHDTGEPTPEWQPMGYHGAYTNVTGRLVNLYDPVDGILGVWITDQEWLKPTPPGYSYDGTNSWNCPLMEPAYMVTDTQESRSMVARSRTGPIGRQGPTGPGGQGVIQSSLDTQAQFGFGSSKDEHSAFFTRPIQTVRPYYQQVLTSCRILPAP